MKELSLAETKGLLSYIAEQMIEKESYLCELDGKIGDGDHGIGIARGFQSVLSEMEKEQDNVQTLFTNAGMAMMNSMGGASGIIFSAMFLGAMTEDSSEQLTVVNLKRYLANGLVRIKQKGGAKLGDKTMIDAFEPAVAALNSYEEEDLTIAFERMRLAAKDGVEKTKEYAAAFGRAKFLGERSLGFCDAGATSVYLIFNYGHEYLSHLNGEM